MEEEINKQNKNEDSDVGERKIDSTEEPIPQDVTKEELQKDQHRKISSEERADSDEYIKEAGLDSNPEEHL